MKKDIVRMSLGVVVMFTLIYSTCLQPIPSFNDLEPTVLDFVQAWYLDINEPKFRSFIHPDSILNNGQINGYLIDRDGIFSGTFYQEPEDVDIRTFNFRKTIETYRGGDQYLNKYFGYLFDDDPKSSHNIKLMRERGVIPNRQYVLATYCIDGLDYIDTCVLSFWVPQETDWKLFFMLYFNEEA